VQNPYASPKAGTADPRPAPRRPVYRSRGRAFSAGAWRGVKFGGGWMGAIVGVLALLLWGLMLATALYRWLTEGVEPWRLVEAIDLFKGILGTLGTIALCAFYGAMIGAFIMGTAAAITYRKPARDASGEPSPQP